MHALPAKHRWGAEEEVLEVEEEQGAKIQKQCVKHQVHPISHQLDSTHHCGPLFFTIIEFIEVFIYSVV